NWAERFAESSRCAPARLRRNCASSMRMRSACALSSRTVRCVSMFSFRGAVSAAGCRVTRSGIVRISRVMHPLAACRAAAEQPLVAHQSVSDLDAIGIDVEQPQLVRMAALAHLHHSQYPLQLAFDLDVALHDDRIGQKS